jgi:hypothetical protein
MIGSTTPEVGGDLEPQEDPSKTTDGANHFAVGALERIKYFQ